MSRIGLLKAALAASAVVMMVASHGQALAQIEKEEQAETDGIGTIVVTAQKREQNLQDVGIAITAFGAEQLEALRIDSAEDIGDAVAGVQVYNFRGKGQPSFVIRGVGTQDFAPNTSPTAAVYIDEVYLGSNVVTGSQVFDIERVEVLKGPQGTLFGRNTTGGAVSYTTKRPTDVVEGYVEAGYGNFDTFDLSAAYGGPISDRVRLRLAGRYGNQGEGFYANIYTPAQNPFPVSPNFFNPDPNIGEDENWSARLLLEADVSDVTTVLLNVHGAGRVSETLPVTPIGFTQIPGAAGTCEVTATSGEFSDPRFCGDAFGFSDLDGDPYTVSNDFVGGNDEDIFGAAVLVESSIGEVDFTSITAYESARKVHFADNDGSPFLQLNNIRDIDFDQFSQEFRLSGSSGSELVWIAGAYYGHDKIDQIFCGDLNPLLGLGVSCRLDFSQVTDSVAGYGQAEYYLTDKLRVTAGLRLTYESRAFDSVSTLTAADGTVSVVDFGIGGGPAQIDETIDTTNVSGKIALDYFVNDDILLYASLSRGFKSGGFEGDFAFSRAQLEPYAEEILNAYELGWKTTLADGAVRLNGAVFYYDYNSPQTRVQAVFLGLPQNQLLNLDSARLIGLEADLAWQATDELFLQVTGTLLDSETSESDPNLALYDGKELPLAASESFTVLARYEQPISDNLTITLQGDGKYNGEYELSPENLGFLQQDSYFLVNSRLSLTSAKGWEISAWGKNLTEEVFAVQSYSLFGSFPVAFNAPRTYGVTVRFDW